MEAAQRVLINPTCQVCEEDVATHFCKCTGFLTFFCLHCSPAHQAKSPRTLHQAIPIALRQSFENYQHKHEALAKAAAELRSNIDRMEQCSSEFADMMHNCINYLIEYRTWWLQQLQTNKEELSLVIETAIQETTHCLDQGTEPSSALGRAMWTLQIEKLQVFKYTLNSPDLTTLCQNWASYESHMKRLSLQSEAVSPVQVSAAQSEEVNVSSLINRALQPQTLLVHVTNSFIRYFDFQNSAWGEPIRLSSQIQISRGSRWVTLEDKRVFCCGGES